MSTTIETVLNFARAQTQTDSNGLTDTNGLIFANEALLDFRRQLISHGVDAAQVQEAYMDATAGVGTYLYPPDMFFLKALEVNYADTQVQNYLTAKQIDVSNLPSWQSFSWFRQNTSIQDPTFDDRGDWFEIFPTPTTANNVSQLMRIFYFLDPTEYVSTSDTLTYPETLDYRLLGWRIAANYWYSLGTTSIPNGDKFMARYQDRLTQLIDTLGRGIQTPNQATVIQITGFEF